MDATEKPILLASLASRNCFARSSPKSYWLLMGTSVEQMAEYSAFSDGFISSICNWASWVFTRPKIAMVPTCCAMILLVSGTEELLISMFVVCKVAKVVLRIICCKFEIFRSFFLSLEVNWLHISGFTFISFTSEQF